MICGHCGASATTLEHVRRCSGLRSAPVRPKSANTLAGQRASVPGQSGVSPSLPSGRPQPRSGALGQRRAMSNDFGYASDFNSGLVHAPRPVEAGAGGRCSDCGVFVPAGTEAMHECRN
jgi:hypothetical protein